MAPSFLTITLVGTGALSAWGLYLDYRQRARTRVTRPEALVAAKQALDMDASAFEKSQSYQADRLSFSMASAVIDLAVTGGLLVGKALPAAWRLAHEATGAPAGGYMHGLAFSLIADVFTTVISIPTSYYNIFVIEERHGFNKQSRRTFFADLAKSFALRVTLLHPISNALFHGVVQVCGAKFPNALFVSGAGFVVALTYIYPTLIQPLFNKYTPLPDGALRDGIEKLATSLHFPLGRIYEVDGSTRSSHSNAYMYGFFNNKRIVLFDTLVQHLNVEEVLAVLSHELGHWYHSHTTANLCMALAQIFMISHALRVALFEPRLLTDFGFSADNSTITLNDGATATNPVLGFQLLSMVLLEPLMTLIGTGMSVLSRRFEFQADRFAVEHMGKGESLRTGLVKISKENKGHVDPDWLYAACRYSHPPMVERLSAINELLKKQQ